MLKMFVECFVLMCLFVVLTITSANAGNLVVEWTAPTTNEDGTPISNLAGFNIYICPTPSCPYEQARMMNVPSPTAISVLMWIEAGTYYITATAYNTVGKESKHSNEIVKTVVDPVIPTPPLCKE